MLVGMIAKMLTEESSVNNVSDPRARNRLTDPICDRVLELDKFRCVAEKYEPDYGKLQ